MHLSLLFGTFLGVEVFQGPTCGGLRVNLLGLRKVHFGIGIRWVFLGDGDLEHESEAG